MSKKLPVGWKKWLVQDEDGSRPFLDQVFLDAVAITPVLGSGNQTFSKRDFMATVKKLAAEGDKK